MNILIWTVDYKPTKGSGIATLVYYLAKYLHQEENKVVVFAPKVKGYKEFDKQQNFTTYRFVNTLFLREIFSLIYLPYILKKERIDAVICSLWFPNGLIFILFKKIMRVSYYVFAHGADIMENIKFHPSFKHRIRSKMKYLKKATFKNCTKIFAISSYTKNILIAQGVKASKIAVINPGVDPNFLSSKERFKEKREEYLNKKIVLTVTRLDFYKGVDTVIKIMPEILKECPETVYLIVGKGPEEDNLKEIVHKLNLDKQVIFLGEVSDEQLIYYYNICDIFIMVSKEMKDAGEVEGFGIVYLEAQVCGKPVIAGRCSGAIDAIIEGRTGFLVNPEDEREIKEAILRLLKDEELKKEMGENAKVWVRRFRWNEIADKVLSEIKL